MRSKSQTTAILSLSLLIPIASYAAPSEPNYGKSAAFSAEQLPPGVLRSRLESLPASAQSRALNWLNSFSFPQSDLDALRIDDQGGVYYADTHTPEPVAAGTASASPETAQITTSEAFSLHSKPGASRVIFVDFDGHTITGTAWNNGRADPLYAKPYDTDNNPASFSNNELSAIAETWHRIADDYAAFDVDVTTEPPLVFNSNTGHLLITDDTDNYGNPMPSQGAGGVAYVNVFGASYYADYSPALVYANNLGPDFPPFIAEAASHEMGHNLGLSHDGTSTSSYYGGHGSGWLSWGPIMGGSYGQNVTQWSRGEYSGANNTQDDIAIIISKLNQDGDDHSDAIVGATPLSINGDGSIVASNPQNDPHNSATANKGVIDSSSDVDSFVFSAGSGTIELQITPAWAAYYRSSYGRGANLDIHAVLLDSAGNVVASVDPSDETNSLISTSVAGGIYYLQINGVGSSLSPYSDYGSQGQYFISGNVALGTSDTTPPNPDPMSWSNPPTASGANAISMTASTAADESGGAVQYFFHCLSGGTGCTDSGWRSDSSYQANGLSSASSYSWQVKARDTAGNETAYSNSASASTDAAPTLPAEPSNLVASDGQNGSALLSWSDNADNESAIEIIRESWHPKRRRWQSNTLLASLPADSTSYSDNSGSGQYRYAVRSVNAQGASAYSVWAEVVVTTASTGGGSGGGSCKGGPKKCPG